MAHEIDLSKYEIRTDMIVDEVEKNKYKCMVKNGIKISHAVLAKNNKYNKKPGNYITLEFNDVTDSENLKKISKALKDELSKLIPKKNKTLVVGLGNIKSTPDSLGPRVIDEIIVTSYLYDMGIDVDDNYSNVSAIKPGVTGETGIETLSIIKGVVKEIKPDLMIIIDSLSTSSLDRLNKSIQINTSGVYPGSGVGNKRKELSKKTLGIPVIIIGVPTVISYNSEKTNLMVTPKEIDFLIDKFVKIISYGINRSLHNI